MTFLQDMYVKHLNTTEQFDSTNTSDKLENDKRFSLTEYFKNFFKETDSIIPVEFQPFDLERDKPLSIYEIPTCLMDGHIITDNNEFDQSVQQGIDIIEKVKEYNGVAVLDWHTESACNAFAYRNHLTILKSILNKYVHDSDVWFATPWEIIRWWHNRKLPLLPVG